MDRIFKFIIRFPWLTILVTLLLTLLFGLQLKKVRLETDMNVYFPEGHPVI